jgi:hypothetical protein
MASKGVVIGGLVENGLAAIASIQGVVPHTSDGGPSGSRHAPKISTAALSVNIRYVPFTPVEKRPEPLKAIAHAKRSKAVLVIAKLDRLARSAHVTATLHKAGVDFVYFPLDRYQCLPVAFTDGSPAARISGPACP